MLKRKSYLIEENIPSFKENKKFVKEYIEKISDNYQIDVFDDKNGNIGEPQKNKRCCLFCGKMEPEASFTQKAHAISESLGNKSIVQNEECDECNNFLEDLSNKILLVIWKFSDPCIKCMEKVESLKMKNTIILVIALILW